MTEQGANANMPLTAQQAKETVKAAMEALRQPDNQKKLQEILEECSKIEDPMMQMHRKFARLLPAVQQVLGTAFKGRDVMSTVMQVQALAASDSELAVNVGKIMRTIGGDLSAVVQDEEFEEVE